MKNANNSFLFRTYVLAFWIMLAFMLVRFYFFYWPFSEESTWPHLEAVTLAYIVCLVGIMLLVRSYHLRGALCRSGPYKIVAHPAYTMYAAADIAIGFGADTSYPIWNVVTSSLFLLSLVVVTYFEEQILLVFYGLTARDHLKRTLSLHGMLNLV